LLTLNRVCGEPNGTPLSLRMFAGKLRSFKHSESVVYARGRKRLTGNRTRADPDQRHDLSRQTESRHTPPKSTSRVASGLFLDGLASEAGQRPASRVAASSHAISGRLSY
jgi:hypothetical protein